MSETVEDLIIVVNGLSYEACYIAAADYFTFEGFTFGHSVLMVPSNDRNRAALEELHTLGLVYLDTERGQVGFRASFRGKLIHGLAKAAIKGPEKS